jgi:hypothetical protein
MPLAPRRDPLRRRTRAEVEAAIAQGEAQLARYLDRLDRCRAEGSDTTCAEILARAAASGIALASGERLRPGDDGEG